MAAPTSPTLAMNLHLQQLNYLRCVADSPTLSAAAAQLSISQPALSQALDEIERRLGLTLFERVGRRRVLNQDGRAVADFASEILGRSEHFAAQLLRRREGDAGVLRVGAIDAGSLYILPEALRRFRRAAPGVDLRLIVGTSAELEDALLRHELDLAFVIGDAHPDERLRRDPLLEEQLFLYGPPGKRAPGANDDWVLYPGRSHTREQIDRELAAHGWTPRVRLESSNPQVLRQMVSLGFGWSVLPRAVAESGSQPLKPARVKPVARRNIVVSRRAAAGEDARAGKFLELAKAWVRRQRGL